MEKSKNTIEIKKEKLLHIYGKFLDRKQQNLTAYSNQLVRSYERSFQKNLIELQNYQRSFENAIKNYLTSQKKHIDNLEKAKEYLDPKNVLKRGFSITQKNNHPVKSIREVETGDTITTFLFEGKVISEVSDKKESSESESQSQK